MLLIERGQDYEDVKADDLPYELLGNLGFGHSGNVEKVKDKVTQAVFARKTIRFTTRRLDRLEKVKVFKNEVGIIRALANHHHIVNVFATYATESYFGIICEPVASDGDLDSYLDNYWKIAREAQDASDPRLNAMVVVLEQAFGCLTTGLAFMRDKRIRHRDIKPTNILVHNGRVIYTDFGYSFDSSGFSRSTTEGHPSGFTRKYSAPEVLEHEKRSSESDVYSLGCVFLELLFALLQSSDAEEEVECYSTRMDDIHDRLKALKFPTQYSVLPQIIREMTLYERTERPSAGSVASRLRVLPKAFCNQCRSASISDGPPQFINGTSSNMSQPQLEWSDVQQKWLMREWDTHHRQWYVRHYVEGHGWSFLAWMPERIIPTPLQPAFEGQSNPFLGDEYAKVPPHGSTYYNTESKSKSHFEELDPSFYVRTRNFFTLGKVFAVMHAEPRGANILGNKSAVSHIQLDEQVFKQIRRFVVVRLRRSHCFAVPIFTYNGRGTTKPGVDADEHTIIYSRGQQPTLVHNEAKISKIPICVVMNSEVAHLSHASRIFFGIHHPIQYNLKVKDIGDVHPEHVGYLLDCFNSVSERETD